MSNELKLVRAKRSESYLKLGLAAPSGGGKTAGALLIAYGLMSEKYPNLSEEELWDKICIIDTENGSGQLYVGSTFGSVTLGDYLAIRIDPPFEVEKYISAIELCEKNDIEVCIIDSTTHAWSGEGGLLELHSDKSKRTGNSFTAWRDVTPLHNKFVGKMLSTKMHIIATMRSKQEYVQDKDDSGRSTVKKLGLEPEQRKGMEYEFTTMLDIDSEHKAFGSKDRTNIFDQKYFMITDETGRKFWRWLSSADTSAKEVIDKFEKEPTPEEQLAELKPIALEMLKQMSDAGKRDEGIEIVKKYTAGGSANPNSIKDLDKMKELIKELESAK